MIVIGLLGAIALIVISAINPIEQSNRARDTRFKADGGQLISALDRYFTGANQFPWMVAPSTLTAEDSFGFITAGADGIGLCGATCSDNGVLISSNELKSEFKNRDFVETTNVGDQLMIGKAAGANSSVYSCFIPLSKSVRSKAVAEVKVNLINTSTGVKTVTDACDADTANWVDSLCYVCIPE